jgi:hypothetical protein
MPGDATRPCYQRRNCLDCKENMCTRPNFRASSLAGTTSIHTPYSAPSAAQTRTFNARALSLLSMPHPQLELSRACSRSKARGHGTSIVTTQFSHDSTRTPITPFVATRSSKTMGRVAAGDPRSIHPTSMFFSILFRPVLMTATSPVHHLTVFHCSTF